MPPTDQHVALWPFVLYAFLVVVIAVAMVVISYVLGERHREHATGEPYESGMLPTGTARLRFPADFYLVAMIFVVFDLETVFIVTWAVAVRQLGWAGYLQILLFISVLAVSLIYLWRTGALDWGASHWKGRMPVPDGGQRDGTVHKNRQTR